MVVRIPVANVIAIMAGRSALVAYAKALAGQLPRRGAGRLDIGPSSSVNVKLGGVPARLAVDYRMRAAGDAQSESGAAIKLTTGF